MSLLDFESFKHLNSSQQNISYWRNALIKLVFCFINDGATFNHVCMLYIMPLVCFDKFNTEGFVISQLGSSYDKVLMFDV